MSGDQRDLIILLIICAIMPAIFSVVLGRLFSGWSIRNNCLCSALPIPAVIWSLCLFVFVNAAISSKQDCGVDACGMAMGFSVIIAFAALLGFAVGLGSAWAVQKLKAK